MKRRIFSFCIGALLMLSMSAAHAGFFSRVWRAIVSTTVTAISAPVEHFINQSTATLNTLQGNLDWRDWVNVAAQDYNNFAEFHHELLAPLLCDTRSVNGLYGSIPTYCFGSSDRDVLQAGVDFLDLYVGGIPHHGQYIVPGVHLTTYTTGFFNVGTPQGIALYPEIAVLCLDDAYACHGGYQGFGGFTGISERGLGGIRQSHPLSNAGLLLHEAHHSVYGAHTCGSGIIPDKDNGLNGPYGLQAEFLIRAASGAVPGLTCDQRVRALAEAGSIAVNRICDPVSQQALAARAAYQPCPPPPPPPRAPGDRRDHDNR